MRKLIAATLFAVASFPLAAQQQSPQPGTATNDKAPPAAAKHGDAAPAQDDAVRQRIGAEGAAGGTRPVPPEKRKAVGAGAGPHIHDTAPSPQKLPRDRPVEPGR